MLEKSQFAKLSHYMVQFLFASFVLYLYWILVSLFLFNSSSLQLCKGMFK